MKIFFNKASLCFSLLLLSAAVYAQSDDTKQVVLEKKMKGNDFIDKISITNDSEVYLRSSGGKIATEIGANVNILSGLIE